MITITNTSDVRVVVPAPMLLTLGAGETSHPLLERQVDLPKVHNIRCLRVARFPVCAPIPALPPVETPVQILAQPEEVCTHTRETVADSPPPVIPTGGKKTRGRGR